MGGCDYYLFVVFVYLFQESSNVYRREKQKKNPALEMLLKKDILQHLVETSSIYTQKKLMQSFTPKPSKK